MSAACGRHQREHSKGERWISSAQDRGQNLMVDIESEYLYLYDFPKCIGVNPGDGGSRPPRFWAGAMGGRRGVVNGSRKTL